MTHVIILISLSRFNKHTKYLNVKAIIILQNKLIVTEINMFEIFVKANEKIFYIQNNNER